MDNSSPVFKQLDHVIARVEDPRALFETLTGTLGPPVAWPPHPAPAAFHVTGTPCAPLIDGGGSIPPIIEGGPMGAPGMGPAPHAGGGGMPPFIIIGGRGSGGPW